MRQLTFVKPGRLEWHIAQAAFGAAWLIKGETFLKDRAI